MPGCYGRDVFGREPGHGGMTVSGRWAIRPSRPEREHVLLAHKRMCLWLYISLSIYTHTYICGERERADVHFSVRL